MLMNILCFALWLTAKLALRCCVCILSGSCRIGSYLPLYFLYFDLGVKIIVSTAPQRSAIFLFLKKHRNTCSSLHLLASSTIQISVM